MTCILDVELPRTLDVLVERLSQPGYRGAQVEAWVFEGAAARAAAEQALAIAGIAARFRSAYKPLLCHVVEELDWALLAAVRLRYPVRREAGERRFLMEAYPLAAMLPAGGFAAEPGDEDLRYGLTLRWADGRAETRRVFAPNAFRKDPNGSTVLSPCAWLRIAGAGQGLDCDGPIPSDLAFAFDAVMAAVDARDWGGEEPFFGVLHIEAAIGGSETRLPVGHERLSLPEALHEDFYFSLLERFHEASGHAPGDRTLRPGQIAPEVVSAPGPTRVRVAVRSDPLPAAGPGEAPSDWSACEGPPPIGSVLASLDGFAGAPLAARSAQGRPVRGVLVEGAGPAVLITGGQHANEASGVVGAIRAGLALRDAGGAFALIPLENPDGYAFHQRLIARNPEHMHHAARYTALGDDLEYRVAAPLFEQEARNAALARTGAQLHINLHGYPAHEWTRPLNGYVPRGFESWALPKGLFLILRHHAGLRAYAETFLERLTASLASDPDLARLNREQLAAYAAHAGDVGHPVINGVACAIVERPLQPTPLQLITEYPDETLHGHAFRLAHRVQRDAALAARALFAGDVAAGRWPPASV